MLKRLVAVASVSALAVIGPATTASADTSPSTSETSGQAVVTKIKKSQRSIDWDAPAPAPGDGTVTTQRIDWD